MVAQRSQSIAESEIWLMRLGASPTYEQISEGGAKKYGPCGARMTRPLYYVSDRSGAQNVWAKDLNGTEPGKSRNLRMDACCGPA